MQNGFSIQQQTPFEALREARQRQREDSLHPLYARRAGVEGTLHQGTVAADLRRARVLLPA